MTAPYILIPDLASRAPDASGAIRSRAIHSDGQVRVLLFRFAPGQRLAEHHTPHAAIIQVLQGTATLTLGSDTVEAEAGTWVHMTPSLRHSVQAHTAVVLLLTVLQG